MLSIASSGLHAGARQQPLDALGIAEDPHEIVVEREIETARARIALTAGSAAQLVVDAPRLVALGADDVQAAHLEDLRVALRPVVVELGDHRLGRRLEPRALAREVAAEHDVRAAAGHVGRDRDGAGPARLHDDLGLALVVLRVQHLVRDALLLQQARQELRRLDRRRADEHGLAARVAVPDVLDDGVETSPRP